MTVLVTGGAGFIGGHVVDALLAGGEAVRVVDLQPPLDRHAGRVEGVVGSITDPSLLAGAMRGVRAVYHLAGIAQLWLRHPGAYEACHVDGTRAVVHAALAAAVERIVHLSSATILVGRSTPVGMTVDEADDPGPAALFGAYARSKWQAEAIALRAGAEEGGIRAVSVLPTLPMGPGDTAPTPPGRLLVDLWRGCCPAFIETRINVIDVRDLARTIIAARHRGEPGQRYLVCGHDLSFADFLAAFHRATGRAVPDRKVPPWLARTTARVSEFWAHRTGGGPPKAPVAGVEIALRRVRFDGRAGRALFGAERRPLSQTLSDSIACLIDGNCPAAAGVSNQNMDNLSRSPIKSE